MFEFKSDIKKENFTIYVIYFISDKY